MITVSIIIVAYKNKKILADCLKSIPKNKEYEVIVIDNSVDNKGFGKACNLGAHKAHGEYLFFLNPDTQLNPLTIPTLLKKSKQHSESGIIAPQLRYKNNQPYSSFSRQPRFWSVLFVYTAINKWFPNNPVSRFYFYTTAGLEKEMYIESASGAAICIKKDLFFKVGGFDEQLFLYWEDYDFCQKILDAHKKILFTPDCYVIHDRGGSTPSNTNAYQLFLDSRKYLFSKRWGILGKALHELLTFGERQHAT